MASLRSDPFGKSTPELLAKDKETWRQSLAYLTSLTPDAAIDFQWPKEKPFKVEDHPEMVGALAQRLSIMDYKSDAFDKIWSSKK